MNERFKAFKTLLGIGLAFAAGYILGSQLKEREMREDCDETIKVHEKNCEERRDKELEKEKEALAEERKAFEEEKEHFNEVKHQLYSDLTKDEQLLQLCDPELGVPIDEEKILRYNSIKRQYLRIDFINETLYGGYIDEDACLNFPTVECHMFKDGTIYNEDGERIDDDDTHLGNLCNGMGTGKADDIRFIRNWEEKVDYCVTYDNEYETGEEWLNEWLGDMGDEEEAVDVDYEEEDGDEEVDN